MWYVNDKITMSVDNARRNITVRNVEKLNGTHCRREIFTFVNGSKKRKIKIYNFISGGDGICGVINFYSMALQRGSLIVQQKK